MACLAAGTAEASREGRRAGQPHMRWLTCCTQSAASANRRACESASARHTQRTKPTTGQLLAAPIDCATAPAWASAPGRRPHSFSVGRAAGVTWDAATAAARPRPLAAERASLWRSAPAPPRAIGAPRHTLARSAAKGRRRARGGRCVPGRLPQLFQQRSCRHSGRCAAAGTRLAATRRAAGRGGVPPGG